MYFQLYRRSQLQNIIAGSIPHNSTFLVHILKVSGLYIDVQVT